MEPPLFGPNDRVAHVERQLFIRAFMPTTPPPTIAEQAALRMNDRFAPSGEVLFERGAPPDTVFFVVEGEVEMRGELPEERLTYGRQSIIGLLDCHAARPRRRTAVTTKPTRLLSISYSAWLEVLEDHPEFTSSSRCDLARELHAIMLGLAPDGGMRLLSKPCAIDEPIARKTVQRDLVATLVLLRSTHAFERCSVQTLAELAERAEIIDRAAGGIIFPPLGGGDRVYLVVSGRVHVERRIEPVLRHTYKPGEMVLAGAAFSGELSTYSATAARDTTVLALSFADIDDVADDHFDLPKSILRAVSLDREELETARAARALSGV